jgi:hypothetical protein
MSNDGVTWFGDCDCGWMSKTYRHEKLAERAVAAHIKNSPGQHIGIAVWLLPGEQLEEENVNG